ncbi:carboxymuconolactone decarboxylase family protein [Streptomyces sp. NPDC087263]|uniref:carboxymuconolactone decarboxylase family protein n=1 Tax=Streptomyces sp. NPDC087263 TaxID=3365773 RepID=UPI0038236B0F
MPDPQPATPYPPATTEPRLAPLGPAQRSEEQRQLLSVVRGDQVPHLFSTLVQHPALFRAWLPLCIQLLRDSVFPPRERELLIIRVSWRCGSAYELENHRAIGARAGLTDDDFAALTGGGPERAWTPRERLLVAAVDELHDDHTIADATWRELSARLTTEQLIELPMLVGHYIMLADTLRALRIPLDEALPGPRLNQ